MKTPTGLWTILVLAVGCGAVYASGGSELIDVNYADLVGRADLTFEKPVPRKEAGLPVGNGRMGTLVWTSPSALKFQINRVDVYANNSATNSFIERDSDYSAGTGFVDVDFVDFGPDVFPAERTLQHLSVYDGLVTVEGRGIKARILAWHAKDVIALEITDTREQPLPIRTSLRMLRPPVVHTRSHLARSELHRRDGHIILTQEFTEGDYYCSSALAIAVVGRESRTRAVNEQELRLSAAPAKGTFTILIGSAATFDRNFDVIAAALAQLDAAAAKGFRALFDDNKGWWHNFWSKAFIHLHSADGVADYVERNYTYFLYVMASSSRGKLPPRYGGMIWFTGGDYRRWGAQHWWHNDSCYYRPIPPSNRSELMDPMFDMYSGMYDACAVAARQQWGSKGIYIPETTWFDGLARLPDDIAAEMRDLYLLRKPWELRSLRFRRFAARKHPHSSRWNWKAKGHWENGEWIYQPKMNGPYGEVIHIFSSGAKIAYLYWLRYEYTLDKEWLRDRAYPMLKGIAEFYRNYPNVRKGPDGKYHIHNVNNHEPIKGAQDTMEEVAAMHGIFPVVIRASEILGVDAEMRPIWREFLENLTPIPTNDDPNSMDPRKPGMPRMWTNGRLPYFSGDIKRRSGHTMIPAAYLDLCTLENPDQELRKVANATFEALFPDGIDARTPVRVLQRTAIAAALLGRAEDVKYLVPNQMKALRPDRDFVDFRLTKAGVLPNRMTLREGVQAIGVQRLGRASEALQAALLQSVPPGPGGQPVIRVFPAWPKQWDAQYNLAARGGFLVTSSMQKGRVEFVEVKSRLGGECRLRNPWGETKVTLYRNGVRDAEISGAVLKFSTTRSEDIIVVPAGVTPTRFKRTIP